MSVEDFENDLLTGLAMDLATATIGTWSAEGVYAADATGIVLAYLPPAPDRVIVLALYGVTDAPVDGDDIIGLQVRTRWEGLDPRPGNRLAARVFDHWHSAHDLTLSTGVRVKQILRASSVSGGRDENDRWSTIQNYYLHLNRPSAHRPT